MALSARHRILSVETASPSWVTVKWADGHISQFPGLWLLAACSCALCGSTESAVRRSLLTELPDEPDVVFAATDAEGCLIVDWGVGHGSRFEPIWLRAHCLSDAERQRRLIKPQLWGGEIGNSLPYMSYTEVSGDSDLHLAFLETLRDLGFVILQDVPADRERTEEVAGLVGKRRITNYGIFELKSKPNPEIVGDMAVALNLHTDEPYRRDPPAITFFHVLAQSSHGGDSRIADGYRVAETLRRKDPEAFEILASTPARFHRTLAEGRAFDIEAPIISLDRAGTVTGIRILDRGMAPVDVAPPSRAHASCAALRRRRHGHGEAAGRRNAGVQQSKGTPRAHCIRSVAFRASCAQLPRRSRRVPFQAAGRLSGTGPGGGMDEVQSRRRSLTTYDLDLIRSFSDFALAGNPIKRNVAATSLIKPTVTAFNIAVLKGRAAGPIR